MTGSDRTDLYGLIGDPVSHSLSPFIMNRAFATLGMNAVYVSFGVRPELLDVTVAGLYSMGASGVNVTYPYKEEILYHVDVLSPAADITQAANTLVFTDDEIHAYNTDAPGTVTALETFAEVTVEGSRVVIFGAGGAARAAAYGLLERGAMTVTLLARTPYRARMATERFAEVFPRQRLDVYSLTDLGYEYHRQRSVEMAEIVINATPVGMSGVDDGCVLENPEWLHEDQCVFDFVYHPAHTPFLEAARQAGARTLGGVALLVSQALESFRIWTDEAFDLKDMAEAIEAFAIAERNDVEGVN